jgi:replicative DNA helicase
LRESGSIEQDADLVGLLVRPEIYEEDEEARAEKEGEAELIIRQTAQRDRWAKFPSPF